MTEYAAVVRHVGYWRGTIHRWSTVYPFVGEAALSGTTAVDAVKTVDDALCWGPSENDGGIFESSLYDLTHKGMPIETNTYFDYTDPGAWLGYGGAGWTEGTGLIYDPSLETAMLIEWAGGIGRTGKPVTFKKWIHAVPRSNSTVGVPDLNDPVLSDLLAEANTVQTILSGHGLLMGNSRRLAGDAHVNHYYGNHQMPKGRKRKKV